MNNNGKSFNGRGFASMVMLVAFCMLIPSGIMMHIYDSPGGEGSRYIAMGMHNIFAIIFVVAGIFHMRYNFRAITRYISAYRKEFAVTALFTIAILLLSIAHSFH